MKRYFVIVLAVIILIAGAFSFVRLSRPHGTKLLNQPTKAREVRPLTTEPDSRFAPLPIEREKHEK